MERGNLHDCGNILVTVKIAQLESYCKVLNAYAKLTVKGRQTTVKDDVFTVVRITVKKTTREAKWKKYSNYGNKLRKVRTLPSVEPPLDKDKFIGHWKTVNDGLRSYDFPQRRNHASTVR